MLVPTNEFVSITNETSKLPVDCLRLKSITHPKQHVFVEMYSLIGSLDLSISSNCTAYIIFLSTDSTCFKNMKFIKNSYFFIWEKTWRIKGFQKKASPR